MDPQEMQYEEYPLHPEYSAPPEYTPEYPDVSYFQESFVTSREENIFQGKAPAGEEDPRAFRREERRKQTRSGWLRNLFRSAMRGGAVVFGLGALITTILSGAVLPKDSIWTPVKAILLDSQGEPFHKTDDYGPEELLLLWNGDPAGPHQYDFDHAYLRQEATCLQNGLVEFHCTECGVALTAEVKGGHTAAEAVRENETEATCTEKGGYDMVVYCSVCHEELSRESFTTDALGHTPGDAVKENEQEPGCTDPGSYDSVIYCSVCQEELSRETITVEAVGHTPAEAVAENEQEANCTESGSYDSVIYCSVCHEELSREEVETDPLGHTPKEEAEIENETAPDCTEEGGYDEVFYCEVCGEEISREYVVVEALGHTEGDPKEENRTEATCTAEGGYDTVIYCSVCNEEISRTHTTLEKIPHTAGTAVRENVREATCTAAGSYEDVVYCSVCHEEMSRTRGTIAAIGHEWGTPTYTWSSDNGSVTATRTCTHDSSHKQTETVSATSRVTKAATCTAAGNRRYTSASFSNSAFAVQTKNVSIAPTGHTAGAATGDWENVVNATCTSAGSYDTNVVRCTVCNEVLSQDHVTIPKLAHSFAMNYDDETTYCTYGCGTPAVTVRFSTSPSGQGTFTYTLNSDFYALLLETECTGMIDVRDSNGKSVLEFEDAIYWGDWTDDYEPGNATGTMTGTYWARYPDDFISGSKINVWLYFEYWDNNHEYCAVSPALTITVP